jgi:hypothetical protein
MYFGMILVPAIEIRGRRETRKKKREKNLDFSIFVIST